MPHDLDALIKWASSSQAESCRNNRSKSNLAEFNTYEPNTDISKFTGESHIDSIYQPKGKVIFKVQLPWS